MKYIISIGRELGSGGKEIADKLAKRLGISVYDRKLLEVAAQESGLHATAFESADEKKSSPFLNSLFLSLRHSITGYFTGNDSCMNRDRLFQIQSDAIRTIAEKESAIIIGRCSEYVLRDHENLISIFITADNSDRVARIMQKDGLDEAAAKEFIENIDKRRRSYHDYYSTGCWGTARTYDICINSSRLGIEGTVEFLHEYVKRHLGL